MNLLSFYKIYYRHRIVKANIFLKFYLFIILPIRYLLNLPFFPKRINLDIYSKKNQYLFQKDLNYLFEFFNSDKGNFYIDKYIQPILSLLPTKFTKDEYAKKKIIVSSIISDLYDKYNILTFYGSNLDLPLKISCQIDTSNKSLEYFLDSFEKILENGILITLKNFIKKNITK